MQIFYQTRATARGGRSGRTQIDDGSIGFDLVHFRDSRSGTNPEQLFAMGYAACFDSALQHVAQSMEWQVSSQCSCEVGIGQDSDGGFGLDIGLTVELRGISGEQARILVEKAHQVCPYSRATRNNVDVRIKVVVVKQEEFDL